MKQNEQNNQHEEFELLRAGFSDQANLLAEDELSDLFGGYYCKPDCPESFVSCSGGYCGDYDGPGQP
ncbi:MAG: hypothetical protein K2H32_02705 [Muribaculaceae bacterium]|nr:hypothetical protein [Muribaculaceae bacterium]MDE7155287.1 hypothetical protein [Muribaculaceae bacterium]MDE7370038.1 hypothetical protein [Muribaculaceae bacterium]